MLRFLKFLTYKFKNRKFYYSYIIKFVNFPGPILVRRFYLGFPPLFSLLINEDIREDWGGGSRKVRGVEGVGRESKVAQESQKLRGLEWNVSVFMIPITYVIS